MVTKGGNKSNTKGGNTAGDEGSRIIETVVEAKMREVISKEFLLFSREEAGWILDITHDYIQMVKHTRSNSEEIRKGYESFLRPDAILPEGVTAEQVATDLEMLKEDAKFLDVAELRTTILRDAAQNFIMSLPDEDENTKQESDTPQATADANVDESVHEVSDSTETVLPE